jgi:hypothetical protein
MGFFNARSLRIAANASRYSQASRFLHFPGIITPDSYLSTNLYLTQSGSLRGMVIAAKFNATACVGWPVLKIMRMEYSGIRGSDTSDTVASTTNMKPRLTGYPNVYEYELNNNVIVRVDDILTISWHGNVSQPDQVRFSLAYYINNGFSVPMVSVVVDDCDDLLTSNALHCTSHVTRNVTITPATQANTNQANESDSEIQLSTTNETIIISGVVVFSLVLLIILLIFLIVFTFVVKRRRKSASMNATDPIEMSTQPQMLHNIPSKSTRLSDFDTIRSCILQGMRGVQH